MKTHIIYTSLIGILLFSISCSSNESETQNISPKTPVQVTLGTVNPSTNSDSYTSSGKIQSTHRANLSTRMMGYVQHVHVRIGDYVTKGQPLIKLNSKDLTAKLAQVEAGISEAQAGFSNAEKDYKRYQALFQTESASQKEFDDITAHFTMAKARLNGAKQLKEEVLAQMEYTNIHAPFSGVISSKFINEGDIANPGMPLLSLENQSNFEVITMVSELEISKIEPDMLVDVKVKSDGRLLSGRVKEISTSTHHSGSQYQVKIQLNESDNLYSGMYTQILFPISNDYKTDKILLPTSALIKRGQLHGVYVVSQQNTAVLRWLRLGEIFKDKVEILSGLNQGDQYILSSKGKLENGSSLTVLK